MGLAITVEAPVEEELVRARRSGRRREEERLTEVVEDVDFEGEEGGFLVVGEEGERVVVGERMGEEGEMGGGEVVRGMGRRVGNWRDFDFGESTSGRDESVWMGGGGG